MDDPPLTISFLHFLVLLYAARWKEHNSLTKAKKILMKKNITEAHCATKNDAHMQSKSVNKL